MKILKTTLLATLVLLLALPALAGREIDERRDVDGDASIRIENLSGVINVTGWDRNEVEIKGELDEKAEKLEIHGGGDELRIKVKYPEKKNLNIRRGSELNVKVPRGCELELVGVSCDLDVRDVRGAINAGTVSGDVTVRGDTAGLEVSSVSGDVLVEGETEHVAVESVSGDVEVRGVRRSLEVSIVSGDVEIGGGELEELSFNAVSGDLKLNASPADDAEWELNCHSGSLTLKLPGDVDAEFDIELFSGDVHNDFGPKAKRTSKYGPGKELRFTAGDGDARIEIATFSGDIRLVKR